MSTSDEIQTKKVCCFRINIGLTKLVSSAKKEKKYKKYVVIKGSYLEHLLQVPSSDIVVPKK